jgi:hypothetical protein
MTMSEQRYKFKFRHRQFEAGDLVPKEWPEGVVQTMLDSHRIEPADEPRKKRGRPPRNKAMESPPADKAA